MFGVVVVYGGLVLMLAGGVSLIKPLRFIGVRTRKRALAVACGGLALVAVGMMLPAGLTRVAGRESLLDEWMPEWQFSERHSLRVQAAPDEAWRAIREVTADEIALFRALTWIRDPHWPGTRREGNIMNPSAGKPILDQAMAGGFRLLAESQTADAPREIVLGTLVMWDGTTRFTEEQSGQERIRRLLATPGNAVATINFRVGDDGGGWCTVSTETRVFATDDSARRRFARYWRVIYPGSSLLRYTWLRAIKRRAERN